MIGRWTAVDWGGASCLTVDDVKNLAQMALLPSDPVAQLPPRVMKVRVGRLVPWSEPEHRCIEAQNLLAKQSVAVSCPGVSPRKVE